MSNPQPPSATDLITGVDVAPAAAVPSPSHRTYSKLRQGFISATITMTVASLVLAQGGESLSRVIALAALTTVVYFVCLQWSARLTREMPLAIGVWIVTAIGSAAAFVALSAFAFWSDVLSMGEIATIVALVYLAIGSFGEVVRRTATGPVRVLIVGAGTAATELMTEIARDGGSPSFSIVGIAAEGTEPLPTGLQVPTVDAEDIHSLVTKVKPDLIVVAVSRGRPAVFAQLLDLASSENFNVLGLPEFYEVAFGRLPVRELTDAWFMSTLHYYLRPYNRTAKRAFDVFLAAFGLVVAAPLVPLVALIVKRTPGPLFYRQQRLGEHGKLFDIVKFRSMRLDAETVGSPVFASEQDPRIIPGGSLLRRLRIDEIPQLWNVLRGEMSIVGPRPERPEFLHLLATEVPYWTQRELLQPGITGWAQIRAGYTADSLGAEEKLSYDLWYLRHRSLLLDAVICLKTITTVLTASGSR